MDRWLGAALDYVPRWLDYQMRLSQQPGCIIAVAHRGKLVFEAAFGVADLATGEALTPRHRFRAASQSKSVTATAIMLLREAGKLTLDEPVGRYVQGLDDAVASITLAQLLSHAGGIIRDGGDDGQFHGRRPFFTERALRASLAPIIPPGERFKYSNHGFGLLGLVVEAITGQEYGGWVQRQIIDRLGLGESTPDMPLPRGAMLAAGHSDAMLLGRRVTIPGDYDTAAIAPAGGLVSTAGDLARFFAQLAPDAKKSLLSPASRREMLRAQWRIPAGGFAQSYGLGVILGASGHWDWFGHTGGLQGYLSRTCMFPAQDLAVSMMTNAIDGWCGAWMEGAVAILRAFAERGPPARRLKEWSGRWWSLWGAVDLVPMGERVLALSPGYINPLTDADEIEVTGRDEGRVAWAQGYGGHGEPVRLQRGKSDKVRAIIYAGSELLPAGKMTRELERRYGAKRRRG